MIIYVQFSKDNPARLIGYFGSPQNPAYYPGYAELEVPEGTAYALNDYFNPADHKFYVDPNFVHLSGWINPDDIYQQALERLFYFVDQAALSVRGPYSELEVNSLYQQEQEAKAWTSDSSSNPVLLNAIVAASSLTLSNLVNKVLENSVKWKEASGNLYGQARVKAGELETLRQEVWAGTKTLSDIQSYDCTVKVPDVVLS